MSKRLDIIDKGLTPEDFIIPARNSRGEVERQWFRCCPELDRAASVLVNSRKFPFKTPGDLYRFCVHYGVKWLEKQSGVTTALQQAEVMFAILRAEEEQQRFGESIQYARNVVDRFVQEGDLVEARRVVADLKTKAAKIEKAHWRKKWLKLIDDTWGHLLDGRQGSVSLRVTRRPDPEERKNPHGVDPDADLETADVD